MAAEEASSVFTNVNDDILQNILERLPAESFACAACVNKTWYRNCGNILNAPVFSSALSAKEDPKDALDEAYEEVFSRPIRPDFAIVYIGMEYDLAVTSWFVFQKLHHSIPVIINQAVGLAGIEIGEETHTISELRWELKEPTTEQNPLNQANAEPMLNGANPLIGGLVLTVGYFPDMKVDVIPLLRSRTHLTNTPLMDYFLLEVRSFAASVPDAANGGYPACMTIFGDNRVDLRALVELLDNAMPAETAIVGDAKGNFMHRRKNPTQSYNANQFFFDAAALVFARDHKKSAVFGETRFRVAVADGISSFGPKITSDAVLEEHPYPLTWIQGVTEGFVQPYPMADSLTVLRSLFVHFGFGEPSFYLLVTKNRQFNAQPTKTVACHEIVTANPNSIMVSGNGIQVGDTFFLMHSDRTTALARVEQARQSMEELDKTEEVLGCLLFCSMYRDDSFFARDFVDTSAFGDKLTGLPLAGVWCANEIGRGAILGDKGLECSYNAHSCVYLVVSHVPPVANN